MSTLQLGDTGDEVSDLQDRLYRLGYELYGGGEYDQYTEAAVRGFQTDYGLEPTGVADDVTISQLSQYGDGPQEDGAAVSESQPLADGGPARVVDSDGKELATGTLKSVNSQGALGELSGPVRTALETALGANIVTAPIPLAIELANALGWTVAMGIDGDVAKLLEGSPVPIGVGLTAGAGLYFAPGDEWGLYGSLGADFGLIEGVSLNGCFAAVMGGSDKMAGTFWALELSGGERLGGGVSLLFNSSLEFVGAAGEVGVCLGLPVNFYGSWSYTWLAPL